jgi:acyl carrier protein
MTQEDIIRKLEQVFKETFEDAEFEFSAHLVRENLKAWDSLGHIRLISAIEESFGVQFALEDFDKLISVQGIAEQVAAKR